jgi:adenylyltransferase/sulfurtransferase
MVSLTPKDFERYNRQMMIRGWGKEGQEKLKSATVAVAGVGGLGCPAAIYLTVAGVGKIVLIDHESVELSNLNRQILHWEEDVDKLKVLSASEKLRRLNSDVQVEVRSDTISEENVRDLIKGVDVLLDGMDNFKTRFILNEACIKEEVPFIHGSIYGLEGRLTTIIPRKTPCLMCIYKTMPPEEKPFPVLGTAPATIACLQVMEAVKMIVGIGDLLLNKMLVFDGADMTFRTVNLFRDADCPVCGGP